MSVSPDSIVFSAPLNVYMVGIKGTGMAAFCELLVNRGVTVSGSDVPDVFYTDAILKDVGVSVHQGFDALHVPADADIVIHSAAYPPGTHPELLRAKELGIPVIVYTRALGLFSRQHVSFGIAGVHGKTTTTALAGSIVRALGLPASTLVGSAVSNFGNRSTFSDGERFFIAETCEYRRHFLNFFPTGILLTSIEMDHQDYFRDIDDITDAFRSYILSLPESGSLVYCHDDENTRKLVGELSVTRPDITFTPYGFSAPGAFRIRGVETSAGLSRFWLEGWNRDFSLRLPGRHLVLNAAGAIAVCMDLLARNASAAFDAMTADRIADGLYSFTGCARRSELISDDHDIVILDDYAHHPTAIRTTLAGFREFYPGRRLVVDFMAHTFSRTEALFEEFAHSFESADVVILHKIYPSARESNGYTVTGQKLFDRVSHLHPSVYYFEEITGSSAHIMSLLHPGDVFVTMGAGDNWRIGREIAELLTERNSKEPTC